MLAPTTEFLERRSETGVENFQSSTQAVAQFSWNLFGRLLP